MSDNKNKKEELQDQASKPEALQVPKVESNETKTPENKGAETGLKPLSIEMVNESVNTENDLETLLFSDSEEDTDTSIMEEAQKLLIKHNKKQIWRCPKKGYWFFDTERVKDYEKLSGIILEEYKLKLESDEDGE